MAELIAWTSVLIGVRPGREAALAASLAGMGVALPKVGRFTEAGGLMLVRVAPFQVWAMRDEPDVALMDELAPLGGEAGLIDQSDSRVGLRLEGVTARARLAHLVPLDLHKTRFGPGQCAQTLMGHMSVLLLQLGDDVYELQGSRSFAESFRHAAGIVAELPPLCEPPIAI